MQAIILAGGQGTRLRPVLQNTPKAMAPLGNKPFLAWLLAYLKTQGMTDIILSTHYLAEQIRAYFKSQFAGLAIDYAEEDQPLGTGGAIVHALRQVVDKRQPVFVLNGDTFLKMNFRDMLAQHQPHTLTLSLKEMADCSRYGKVTVENNIVQQFCEKGVSGPGLINAGVYLLSPDFFSRFPLPAQFSFEDFLSAQSKTKMIAARSYVTQGDFIDIGIPADYARAASCSIVSF